MNQNSQALHGSAPRPPSGGTGGAVIDFGKGHPSADLLPFDAMAEAGAVVMERHDPTTLQYGAERGPLGLREEIAAYANRRQAHGAALAPDGLVVTGGISQALDLLCTLVTKPGDVMLVEEPTYHLAKLVFRDHGLRQVGVASDAGGMVPEALDEALSRHPGASVYLVPAFGNPTGASLDPGRAKRIVEVSEHHGAWLLADEVYRYLSFSNQPQGSLAGHGASRVVALNSFSKILAPGLRLGWLVAAPEVLARFENSGLLQSGGGMNPLVGALVEHALRSGAADAHLTKLNAAFEQRAAVLSAALRHHLPTAEFMEPRGGYFIWLRVPGVADTAGATLRQAVANGVRFAPGAAFSTSDMQHDRMRLSFAHYAPANLELGSARLAAALTSASASSQDPT